MHRSQAGNIIKTQKPFPDKLFYKIGEVSRIAGVEPYVLRYWESEFPQIRPSRADSNQRTYQRKDLEILLGLLPALRKSGPN